MGDVSRAEAADIAERLQRTCHKERPADVLPPVSLPAPEIEKIPHPATQSHILLAYPGLQRDDPDYFPLLVGNHILGSGGFTSRLMEEIRQKRGLAYSVHSSFVSAQGKGAF